MSSGVISTSGASAYLLVRTTSLTNQQIKRQLGLTWTGPVRIGRKDFHDELRARGEPVPRCRCGDEFEHAHRCSFKGNSPKPFDPCDAHEAIKDLKAGAPLKQLMIRFSVSNAAAVQLLEALTPTQRAKRRKSVAARRAATRRRNGNSARFEGLYERLDAALPKSLPAEVRSEALQEMATQILNGEIVEQQAIKQYRSSISAAFRRLGNQWSTMSIDAEVEGGRFVDLIEDHQALDQFSALDEMELASS